MSERELLVELKRVLTIALRASEATVSRDIRWLRTYPPAWGRSSGPSSRAPRDGGGRCKPAQAVPVGDREGWSARLAPADVANQGKVFGHPLGWIRADLDRRRERRKTQDLRPSRSMPPSSATQRAHAG